LELNVFGIRFDSETYPTLAAKVENPHG